MAGESLGSGGQPCVTLHSVMIHDRGGKRRLNALRDLTQVKWGRLLDGTKVFTVTITGKKECASQTAVLDAIEPMRHEMVIFRGAQRVAEGPILQVKWLINSVVITAKDVSFYLDRTSMSKDWPGPDLGGAPLMTNRIAGVIAYELTTPYQMLTGTGGGATLVTVTRHEQQSPPINLLPYLDVRLSTTLFTTASVEAFEMSVGQHLRNLARNSLNFTTVGRRIVIWDSNYLLSKTRKLTNADFNGDLEVIKNGSDFATINHLSSSRPDEPPAIAPATGVTIGVGHAGGNDAYYGAWEFIGTSQSEEASSDPTQDELNSQAQRLDRGHRTMGYELRIPASSGLRLSNDLTIDMLVPGTVLPVSAKFNLKEVVQDQILTDLTVTETPGNETVQVTLAPAGDLVVV